METWCFTSSHEFGAKITTGVVRITTNIQTLLYNMWVRQCHMYAIIKLSVTDTQVLIWPITLECYTRNNSLIIVYIMYDYQTYNSTDHRNEHTIIYFQQQWQRWHWTETYSFLPGGRPIITKMTVLQKRRGHGRLIF